MNPDIYKLLSLLSVCALCTQVRDYVQRSKCDSFFVCTFLFFFLCRQGHICLPIFYEVTYLLLFSLFFFFVTDLLAPFQSLLSPLGCPFALLI